MAETEKLKLPKISGNMTADVVRDLNALAEAIDEKVGVPGGLATLDAEGKLPTDQLDFDTSDLATKTELEAHVNNADVHVTPAKKAEWDAKETPQGAQQKANQAEQNAKNYSDQQVSAHASRTDNPHGVTKDQVGLGNVQNYGIATEAEATAGTASNKYMTPQRTKQAIDALQAVKSVNGKTGAVTLSKGDIGLGNVDNVKQASKAEFDAHKAEIATETEYGHVRLQDIPKGKKVARFVIGTFASGWTQNDVDYLCDGVDDQEEINAAIQALPVSGGEIIILDGTYNITAKINVNKSNISIKGNGNATILKRMWNSGSKEGVITLNSVSNCKIENLQIDGNKSVYTSLYNYGIYLDTSSNNNTVTGNTCNNNSSRGIALSNSSNNTVTGNTCNNNDYGIYLDTSSNNNTVTGNTCNNNDDYGIHLDTSSNNNTVTDNTCNNNSIRGISLPNSSNNTVTGNTCNNNDYGIALIASSNNTVTGNTCNNNNNYGIYLIASSNNTVTGNTCIRGTGQPSDYTSSQYTIRLAGSDNNYNLISSNNCMGKDVVIEGGTSNTSVNNKYN